MHACNDFGLDRLELRTVRDAEGFAARCATPEGGLRGANSSFVLATQTRISTQISTLPRNVENPQTEMSG